MNEHGITVWVSTRALVLALVIAFGFGLVACAQAPISHISSAQSATTTTLGASSSTAVSLPAGTWSARQACRAIVNRGPSGFFTDVERVHLVLTTYAQGEPVESQGDINHAMPPNTPVWVVDVHAKAINWNHSVPAGYKPPKQPDDDYSVVMNATTGRVTDAGECRCWPLPLGTLGDVVSLPSDC